MGGNKIVISKVSATGMVDISLLNAVERRVFALFLGYERQRHMDDIHNIDETLRLMREYKDDL